MPNSDSAILTNEISNGESLWKKTSSFVSERSETLSAEEKSSLNQMISKINENINEIVGGRTLEEFKFNETAVEQVSSNLLLIMQLLKPYRNKKGRIFVWDAHQ